MSVKEKLKMFNEEISSMTKLLEKNQSIDQTLVSNRITLIKEDLMSEDENTKRTAQDMLEILLNQKSLQVQTEIIKSSIDDSGNDLFVSLVFKSVRRRAIDNIMTAQNFTDILIPWHDVNTMKMRSILEDVFTNELPREKCKYFLISKVIPAMMLLSTEKTLRNIYIEIAFLLSEIISISELTPEEVVKFIKDINTKYIGGISQLRDSGFLNWHKLWIFLVRFCEKEIHNSMDLTNRLLRVVEFAFRNSSVEQRLKGYDCWKELIDNASLDKNHICSTKQIKLLITPLRAKFSKQEVVICKRFEIFVHLLQKLQQEAILCLKDFLEFCFGSVHGNNDTRSGQGRAIPQLWMKSTKVLVEVIGHSHGNSIECLNTKDVINLGEPIINIKNIHKFYKVIMNSVTESCILLKDVDMESKRMEVIKCMWVTVFDIVVPGSCKEEYFQILSEVLDKFIHLSTSESYFQDLIVLIFTVLMSFEEDMILVYIKSILSQILTILFTAHNIPLNISENFKQALMHSFSKVIHKEDKVKMMNIIMSCYANIKPHEDTISNMAKVWIFLALDLVSDLTVLKIEEFPKLNEFFMWPALNMHRMDETSKKSTTLNWLKIYKKLNQDSDTKKLQVMKDLENIFKNNPLLSSNVITLLNIMSQFETKFTQDYVNRIMKVSSMILVLPNLKSDDENKLTTLVMQYFEPSLECYKQESDEVIMNLCTSIENILRIHGGYRILEPLTSFLKKSRKEIRAKFSKYLENPLLDLFNKESDSNCYNAKELSKALQVINENDDGVKRTFIMPTGRSARIANLAKNIPKSSNKQKKAVASPTAMKLFGKDLETMSPLKVKGSQINNTPSKKKKIANSSRNKSSTTPSINDESSSEFVSIDTEIKLQPDKLSDHQREVMRKRREDIPALYQDLSQSMSQDMFSSKSNSKEEIKTGPKVVVEYVEPLSMSTEVDIRNWGYKEENEKIENIDKPQEAYELSNNVQDSESDMFSNASNDPIMNNIKSSEIIITTDIEIPKEEAVRKLVENEQKISSDLFSDECQLSTSGKKQEEKSGMNKKKLDEDNEEKKRRKMEAELLKLKMDIVGAAEFVATAQRTRHKEKFKKLEEISKNKTPPKPEKGRKSLSLERNDSKIAMKRRKSSGAVLVSSDLSSAFSQSEISPPSNDEVQPQKGPKSDEENEDSIERLKCNPHVEIITPNGNNDKKEITLSKKKSGKMKQVPQRMPDDKESTKHSQLDDEKKAPAGKESSAKNNLLENRDSVLKVALKTNTKGKSLKITIGNENPTSEKKRGRPTKKDKSKESSAPCASINDTSKENVDIQPSDQFIQTIDESSHCTPKRGLKRKYSTDEEDEDIIQSSQESAAEVTPLLNSSKKKQNKNSLEKSKSFEENTIVQQKTVTAADFIMNETNSCEELIYQEKGITEVSIVAKEIEKSNDTETMKAQTEDLIKECDGTLETSDLIKDIQEEKPEEMVEICDGVKNISSVQQSIEVALKQVVNLEKETEESGNKNEEFRDGSSVVEATEVDNLNEVIAEELLEANTTQDTTVTHEITQESSIIQDSTQEDFPSEIGDKNDVETQDTQTQPLPIITQETPTQESNITSSEDVRPHVFYFDLPKKPILTESEQMMCKMDTMSTCLQNDSEAREENMESRRGQEVVELKAAFNDKGAESIEDILATPSTGSPPLSTPPRSPNRSIPSSPITFDTPNRTSELLDNTIDISPITSTTNSPVTEVSAEIPKAIAIFFREEDDDYKDIDNSLEEGSSFCDECEDRQNAIEETEKAHSEEDLIFEAADKTAALTPAALPKPLDPRQTHPVAAARLCSMGVVSPVPTKLFLKRRGGGVACSPSTGRIKRLMSHLGPKQPVGSVDVEEEIDDDDILRFTRDIPSPLAVPRSGILKRKLSDLSDGDGLSPCAKRKRVNFSDPCLTSRKIFIKDDYQPSLEAKRLFDPIPKTNQVTLRDLFNFPEDSGTPETIAESDCPETEPSLEIVNPMMLRKDRPIYPKLVDCKDDVLVILKRVTSPIFITALTNKLKTKNIRTIGDLAQQTESEINRIPFKVPVVANVYKALDSYYRMKNGITGTEIGIVPKCNGNKEVEKKAENVEVTKVNVATEMKSLVEKATKENNTLEDLARILLSSMGKQKIIDTLKKLDSPVTVEDFLDGTSHDQVLKHVLNEKDSAEVLETVQRNLNQVQRDNLPWESLLKDRPVSDLKRGITAITEQNLFSRAEIIENCLLPLVRNPAEIAAYLNSLSVLDFGVLVAERLENENAGEFLCRIIKSHPTSTPETFMKMLCDNKVLSDTNLISSFQVCLESQSDECKKETMVEMFRFISEKLDVTTLGSLHVEFINKLINKN